MNRFSLRKIAERAAACLALVGVGALLGGLSRPAFADAASYASERRQIKACVLVSSASVNAGGKENAVPHLFYIMDRRADLKPNGWEFVNPLAASTISGDIYARWKQRDTGNVDPAFIAGNPISDVFRIGAALTKNMGAYWEEDLDTISPDDLLQYDVVLFASKNPNISLNTDERDKLRRFTDSGGTIWLEDEGGANFNGGPFFTDVSFDVNLPAAPPQLNTSHHPLVNFPFGFSAYDTQFLGFGETGVHHSHRDAVHNILVNPRFLAPIVLKGGVPLISAGDFGAGHVVISSTGIATGINSYAGGVNVGGGGNTGAVSGELLLGALPSDIKFAYNLVAWTSSIPTANVNARRSGGTSENIGADLGRKWQTAPAAVAPTGLGSGAVIHKGVVFWVDGDNILHAYDVSPTQDLDNDQNSDDGIPDYILGAPYDQIWNVDLKSFGAAAATRVSTPTIISANSSLTASAPVDLVVVTLSNGITLAFDAFPRDASGRLQQTSTLQWKVVSPNSTDIAGSIMDDHGYSLPAPSPAFSEGILFTLFDDSTTSPNNSWRVVPIDPLTGANVFDGSAMNGGASNTAGVAPSTKFNTIPGLSKPVAPLTAAYIRDQATGALDKVIYVDTTPFNNGINANGGGQVVGCWFSAKQDPLLPVDNNNPGAGQHKRYRATGERGRLPWYTRNAAPALPGLDLNPVLYRITNGVTTRLTYNTDFTITYEGAAPNRDLIVTLVNPLTDNDKVFADYTLDWPDADLAAVPNSQPAAPNGAELLRFTSRRFTVPTPIPNTPLLITGSALSANDSLIVNSGDFPGFDKVYAVLDQFATTQQAGRASAARIAWAFGPNGTSDTTNPIDPDANVGINGLKPRFINADPWVPEPPAMPGIPLICTDWELVGSPGISNGVVYEVGYCHMRSAGGISATLYNATVITALRANPDMTFTITQNGQAFQFPKNDNGTLVTLQQLDLVNSRPGNPRYVTLFENVNFTVDRESASVHIFDCRQQNGETFNTALPIYVRIGATLLADPIVNPNTGYGPLDNVLWWTVIPQDPAGNVVGGLQPDLKKIAADINPSSGCTVVGDTLYFGTTGGSVAAFDLTGIQNTGGQSKVYHGDGTLRIHKQPAIIDPANGVLPLPNNIIHPPLATTGIVVVGTPRGLLASDNQLTLIADNNRLLEVDRAGKAVHSVDSTQTITVAGGATIIPPDSGQIINTKIPLNRPSIARRTGLNEYLICDTGNNRVVQMSKGGLVSWELHNVNNGMLFLRPSDPLTLNLPTDVQTYTDSSLNGTISIKNPSTGVTYSYTGYYYATHYIIADSGNFRGLEVVDVVDQTNTPITLVSSDPAYPNVKMQRQVAFVTRSLGEQNRNWRYRTMQQFVAQSKANPAVLDTFMVAAVDNVRLGAIDPSAIAVGNSGTDREGPGGAIVLINRYPSKPGVKDGDVAAVINAFAFLDSNGKVLSDSKGNIVRQAINNPTYFREYQEATLVGGNLVPSPKYLLADANGVYQLRPSTAADVTQGGSALNGPEAVVEWMLTSDDYLFLTGRPLRAMSIQKLQDADPFYVGGNVAGFKPRFLITNGYSGLDNVGTVFKDARVLPGEMHGEAFEIRSLDYYLFSDNNTKLYDGYRVTGVDMQGVQRNPRLYAPTAPPPMLPSVLAKNPITSIVWMVPNEALPGRDAANNPLTKPIKRSIGLTDGGTATYLLEQPTSSTRPF